MPSALSNPATGRSQRRRRLAATPSALAVASLALLLTACGGGERSGPVASDAQRCGLEAAEPGQVELPAPTGRYCVGKLRQQLTTRTPDPRAPQGAMARQLSVQVWYPALDAAHHGPRARYMDPEVLQLTETAFQLPPGALRAPAAHAREGVPMREDRRWPVVVFSPGFMAVSDSYSALLEELASQGFVVLAIDHPYISGPTRLTDGSLAMPALPGDLDDPQAFITAAMFALSSDQRLVVDWLHGLQPDDGPAGRLLARRVDLSRLSAGGHSLGGAAALWTARRDERVRAALNIDGTVLGDLSGAWPKPLMFLLEDGPADASMQSVLAHATGPHASYTVAGAGHLDFSDLKHALQRLVPPLSPAQWRELGLGPIEATAATRITREQAVRFFRDQAAASSGPDRE